MCIPWVSLEPCVDEYKMSTMRYSIKYAECCFTGEYKNPANLYITTATMSVSIDASTSTAP